MPSSGQYKSLGFSEDAEIQAALSGPAVPGEKPWHPPDEADEALAEAEAPTSSTVPLLKDP